MLNIRSVSGEVLASVPARKEWSVRDLKAQVCRMHKISIFRQELVHGAAVLDNDTKLMSPADIQLVLMPLSDASPEETRSLCAAVEGGQTQRVRHMLENCQNPDATAHQQSPLCAAVRHDRNEAGLFTYAFCLFIPEVKSDT